MPCFILLKLSLYHWFPAFFVFSPSMVLHEFLIFHVSIRGIYLQGFTNIPILFCTYSKTLLSIGL